MASYQDVQAALQQQGAVAPPTGAPAMAPVIDVSGSTPSSPAIPAGQPGSQLAPTAVTSTAPTDPTTMGVPTMTVRPDGAAAGSSVSNKLAIIDKAAAGPVPLPSDPEFPVKPDQKTGYLANIGAGTSQSVAQQLGLPVDTLTAIINAGAAALGLPPIKDPIGGSKTFEKLEGLIGANPENVAPADQGERLARAAASGATGAMLPGGVASKMVRATLPGVAAVPALEALAGGAGIVSGVAGAAGGVGGEMAEEAAPDRFKPLAGLIGGLAGAGPVAAGADLLARGGRAVGGAVSQALHPDTDTMAGKVLLQRSQGAVPTMETAPIPNMPLDLGQSSNNPGLASHVRQVNQREPIGANIIRERQNAAIEAAATTAQPGAPVPPARTGGISAHHGTPYAFDAFDIGKVGSGEGAQAFGHGLYFAENQEVADGYRATLARAKMTPEAVAASKAVNDAITAKNAKFAELTGQGMTDEALDAALEPWTKKVNEAWAAFNKIPKNEGNLYGVKLHARPDELLDWDKPLSAQSQQVRDALKSLGYTEAEDPKGSDVYRRLAETLFSPADFRKAGGAAGAQAEISAALNRVDIKGIRYLDGGSRAMSPLSSKGLEEYFKPGELVASYGGQDRVVRFNPGDPAQGGYGWSVDVRSVDRNGEPVGPTRQHSTLPEPRTIAAAERARGVTFEKPAGTSNIVMFDHNDVEITHKNGIALPRPVNLATQLASERMSPADASARVVEGLQNAYGVLKDEADRLWSDPAIVNKTPDMKALTASVRKSFDQLPMRVRAAVDRNPDLRAALDYLFNLPEGATLPDVNQARSDILEASRSLPFPERMARRAANTAADAVLNAIETNPAMRGDPAAWKAYVEARQFTASMYETLGKPAFQSMLEAAGSNRKGLDVGTIASKLYNFARGTEKTPGGIKQITDMLDGVQAQWNQLRGMGNTMHDPAVAAAARDELAQASRDFIINTMLDSASSVARDTAGNQNALMNRLSDWIDTNKDWMQRSGQFNQSQIDLLENIRRAAVMSARTENLRGGPGSPTFELLKGDRFVDAFVGPLLGRSISAAGGLALGGLITGIFGEAGIGSMIGAELTGGAIGHGGRQMMENFYSKPRAEIVQKLQEAARDPDLARDLMLKATAANVAKMSPKTKVWIRTFLGAQPAGAISQIGGN